MEKMQSKEINELATALTQFQAQVKNPERNRTVEVTTDRGKYEFKYATFDSILDLIRRPLADCGLSFSQPITIVGEHTVVRTTIMHTGGQWMTSEMPLTMGRGTGPQAVGSAITYARRYGLCSMLGIVSEDDDDAESSEKPAAQKTNDEATKATAWGRKFFKKIEKAPNAEGVKFLMSSNKGNLEALSSCNKGAHDKLIEKAKGAKWDGLFEEGVKQEEMK